MHPFEYHRAASVTDAAEAFTAAADAAFLSGGQSLVPSMKLRLAAHDRLVDLTRIPGLDGIRRDGDRLVIGALATHARVSADATVRDAIPALAEMVGSIGDPGVRSRGTIGGSVANNDPAADYPAACLALDAVIRTDRRDFAAADFFHSFFETALEPGELVTEVSFAIPAAAGYSKVRSPASRYALCGVFVARLDDGIRVAVTGAGPQVFRVEAMEQALAAEFSAQAVRGLTMPTDGLNDDPQASAEYRAHLIPVCAARAVAAALGSG